MRPPAGEVCHSLIVVSYCKPGSADSHAARAMRAQRSRACTVFSTLPSVRRTRSHEPSSRTARRKSAFTRTELFEFWPETVRYASPCQSVSNSLKSRASPCAASCSARWMYASSTPSRRARETALRSGRFSIGSSPPSSAASKIARSRRRVSREPVTSAATFCSSSTFQPMNCSMSGWSALTITIFAARRVVPPDLIAPAARSPILRNDISPDDFPPPDSCSFSPRRREKLEPVPDPYLKMRASRVHRSMIPPSFTRSSFTDWMKQACGCGRSYALVEAVSTPVTWST